MIPDKIFTPYTISPQINIVTMYSFFRSRYDKGYEFPGETHNFWECVYVLSGEVNVAADERIYTMKQGELIFHKPLELHKFHVSNPAGASLLIFSFSAEGPLTDWFRNKVFSLTASQKELLRSLLAYAEEKLHLLAKNSPDINLKDNRELNYYLQPINLIPEYAQVVCSCFHQLFLSLTEDGTVSEESSSPDALLFKEAISYMNANLSGQPAISEIARHCNVSDATLKRLFDKHAGISVHKYFLTLKINASIKLLESGASVTNTADQLGFTSQSYFSKTFKRIVGISPTQYGQEVS